MIVIDTSALAAIYRREPDDHLYQETIAKAETLVMPASVYVEFTSPRRYGEPRRWLDLAIEQYGISIGEINPAAALLLRMQSNAMAVAPVTRRA